MLADYSFLIQPIARAQFGAGSVKKLPKLCKAQGKRSALIVSDPGVIKAGVVEPVLQALRAGDVDVTVFDGVAPNPTRGDVEAGVEVLRELSDPVVIAVGGGSALDAAKAIALMGPNAGGLGDFAPGCKPKRPGQPVIAVPTTSGTGSETNMFAVITDETLSKKQLVGHLSVQPVISVLDPSLTLGLPAAVTATTGMDVLTHAVEAFSSARSNPLADSVALRAIAMTTAYLPRAFDDGSDVEARAQMLLAAHLAGIAFSSAGLGMCHAMGHPLSARLGVAHGQSLASLLPDVMRFNRHTCESKYAQIAIAMGATEPGADNATNSERAVSAVERLRARVKTDLTLEALGVTEPGIVQLVDDALADPLMITTPRQPTREEVAHLYRAALV